MISFIPASIAHVGSTTPDLVAAIAAAGNKEAEREAAVVAGRDDAAKAKMKEIGSYMSKIPVYGTLAGAFFTYGGAALVDLGAFLRGKNEDNTDEQRDRALGLIDPLMAFGRPPGQIDTAMEWWRQYGDRLQRNLDAFNALPEDKKNACLWMGKALTKVQSDSDVIALFVTEGFGPNQQPAIVGDDGEFIGTAPGVIDATGTVTHKSASIRWFNVSKDDGRTCRVMTVLPFEPMLAAAIVSKAVDRDLESVRHAAIDAWVQWFADHSDIWPPYDGTGASCQTVDQYHYVNDNESALMADRWATICQALQAAAKAAPTMRISAHQFQAFRPITSINASSIRALQFTPANKQGAAAPSPDSGMSTASKVVLGVGIVAAAGDLFYLAKKRRSHGL